MLLQHVLGGFRNDVAELAGVGGHDLDHAVDHLLGVEVTVRCAQEVIERFAQCRALW